MRLHNESGTEPEPIESDADRIRVEKLELEDRVRERTAELEAAIRDKDDALAREEDARRLAARAAERTAILHAVTVALSDALSPAEVADVIVDRAIGTLGARAGSMVLVCPDGERLQLLRAVGFAEELVDRWREFPISAATPLSDSVRLQEPIFVDSKDAFLSRYPEMGLADADMQEGAWVAVPLILEGRPLGAIGLSFSDRRAFNEDDRVFMMALGRQSAQAIERARLHEAERAAHADAEAARDRLSFLAAASEVLAASLDYTETLSAVAALAVPHVSDWCTVDMVEEDGSIRQLAVTHVDPDKVELARRLRERYPVDSSSDQALPKVIRTGVPELYEEIDQTLIEQNAPDAEFLEIIKKLGLRSAMFVPMITRRRVIGVITFVTSESGRTYGPADLQLAKDLARRAAIAVENARLYQERDHIARTLQRSLLPPRLPDIPGLEVAARYRPTGSGNDVGGDFYDVFATGDGAWGLVMGDVRGKGPDAAAVTGLVRHTVRAAAMHEKRPSRILATLNAALLEQAADERFSTVAYARLRPSKGGARLTICCGGHPLPYLLRADGTLEEAGRTGTLLGLFPDPDLSDQAVDLGPGDVLVVYTDGVTEERSDGDYFGEDRLAEVIRSQRGADAETVAESIERAVLGFGGQEPRDDVAVLVVRARPEVSGQG